MSRSLRSGRWFDGHDVPGLLHRSALRAQGFSVSAGEGQPIIGICNSWSELVNCNVHLRALGAAVKRGVSAAGGVPLEFNTVSLGEQLMKPTTMLYRNLMAMDVEECLRSYPLDAVVLLGGCDKTIPAQLLGAASADVPAIALSGGPATPAVFRERAVSVGTDLWRYTDQLRAGQITQADYDDFEAAAGPSPGHCPEMGTASTMAALLEGLGMALPGSACVPAMDARRLQVAEATGARAVAVAREALRPSAILTEDALHNAITLLMGIGGSVNAIVHLLALAGRIGVELPLRRFDEVARRTPAIVDVQPVGGHLVEQLFHGGGIPAVLAELRPLLREDALTITGHTLGAALRPKRPDAAVIRSLQDPVRPAGGVAVLHGSLAPDGAVIKPSVAEPALLEHEGKALVFEDIDDVAARIDDPDLAAEPGTVMVLRNTGPRGGPGMPEWGQLPIPQKLLRAGVRDMLRISDARMSGTAFGAVVLHVAPEAAVGGPLGLVRDGDRIAVSVRERRIDLLVDEEELGCRRQSWRPPPAAYRRGYGALYLEHVLQADQGCDFDFLRGRSAHPESEPRGVLRGMIGGW
ncbi:MAG: dihydroxy-acid dehydratase [Solirubrobacteraceae bacterium]